MRMPKPRSINDLSLEDMITLVAEDGCEIIINKAPYSSDWEVNIWDVELDNDVTYYGSNNQSLESIFFNHLRKNT